MSYSWRPEDVLDLLNIPRQANRSNVYITCPFCGGRRFSFSMSKGIGKCFQCEKGADTASYYAVTMNMSLNEARRDIERRLGIINEDGKRNENYTPRIVYNTQNKEAERASDEVLDKTYRAFLAELQLCEKNRAMLKARGLTDARIQELNYRTLPRRDEIDYFALCRRLQEDGYTLKGVPGFFKTSKGDYTFTQLTKGIVMPVINRKNQVIGLQIRKDDDLRVYIEEEGDYEAKCSWFSSKNRTGGAAATAPVHYACDFRFNKETQSYEPLLPEKGVLLTEGIMKGDITHFCQPNIPVISVPGVHAIKYLEEELKYLKSVGLETVLLAYDMDYATNKYVQNALENTKSVIEGLGLRCKQISWESKINIEGKDVNINGIDDYLVFTKYGIVPQVKHK